jgi:hypothetical protein
MITSVIARVHAGDQAGAGRNWLLAWLVVGTVVITGISEWLSADLVDITSLRQAYGFTLVAVLGYAAIIGRLPAMRAHPRHRRPGRALAIVLTLNLFSVTMTLLSGSLISPLPGAWINVDSHTIAIALALYTAFTLSLLRLPTVSTQKPAVISGSPGKVIGLRVLPAMTIATIAGVMHALSMLGQLGVTTLIIFAVGMVIMDMRRLARGCTASGHRAEPAPDTEAGFVAIARAARHIGERASGWALALTLALTIAAAWPLLSGDGAWHGLNALVLVLSLLPVAVASMFHALAGLSHTTSRHDATHSGVPQP